MPQLNAHCFLILALVAAPSAAFSDTRAPTAIVEDVTATVTAVAPLDLLRVGDTVDLRADQGLIISYLESCQRENIRGGRVDIGQLQSTVTGGVVSRQAVPCDAAALDLTPDQANQSAALAFRLPDSPEAGDPVAALAQFVMATRHPIIVSPGLDKVSLEDLRQPGKKQTHLARNGVIELTTEAAPLEKGGVYRLEAGDRSLVFRIGREASNAPLPLLKRVIRF